MTQPLYRRLAAAAAIATILLIGSKFIPKDAIIAAIQKLHSYGIAGMAAFAALYTVSAVLMFPAAILTLAAGALWGPWVGLLIVSPASVAAAWGTFALSRGALRKPIAQYLAKHPRIEAFNTAVAGKGFYVVLLLRLSPLLPFNLLNAALGLGQIAIRHYILASWIGMLPGTALYIYAGSLLGNLTGTQLQSGNPNLNATTTSIFLGLGLLATALVSVLLGQIAKKTLKESHPSNPPSSSN